MTKLLSFALACCVCAFAQTASYPGAVATDATMFKAANNVGTTLYQAQASTDTTLVVASSAGFTANMLVSVGPAGASEIEAVCLVTGNTLTVGAGGVCPSIAGRGFDFTSITAHIAASPVNVNYVAWMHNVTRAEIEAMEATLGPNLSAAIAATLAPNLANVLSNLPAHVGAATLNQTAYYSAAGTVGGVGPGTAGQVYTSNGPGSPGSFQAPPAGAAVANIYSWAPQSPGGSLASGSNTITLNPVPPGVAAAFVGQQVYVSGGTGTAEACTSTGLSGAMLIVTCANAHSGAWTVQSATGGGGEALAAGASSIYFPSAAPATFYGTVVIPGARVVAFYGDSMYSPAVIRSSNNTTGDLFYGPGSGETVSFSNLYLNNGPADSGRAIHMVTGALHIAGVYCLQGIFVDMDSVALSQISDFQYYTLGSPPAVIIYRGDTNNAGCSSGHLTNGQIYAGLSLYYGVYITGMDYLEIDNVLFDGMGYGIYAQPAPNDASASWAASTGYSLGQLILDSAGHAQKVTTAGASGTTIPPFNNSGGATSDGSVVWVDFGAGPYVANINVVNSAFDAGSAVSHAVSGAAFENRAGRGIGFISVIGCTFGAYATTTTEYALDLGSQVPGTLYSVLVENNLFLEWTWGAIGYGHTAGSGDTTTIISGNTIFDNNISHGEPYGAEIVLGNPQGVSITNNKIQNTTGYGIYWFGGAASTGVMIANNQMGLNTLGPIFIDAYPTASTIIKDNIGIDDVEGTVADAAALPVPLNPIFSLTGTGTAITSIVGIWPGRTFTMLPTGASIAFTAGATIGANFSTITGVPVNGSVDATGHVWLK